MPRGSRLPNHSRPLPYSPCADPSFGTLFHGTCLAEITGVKLRPHVPVAIFLTSFHPGGTERQMVELARTLDRSRFTVHLACFRREGAWLARAVERASIDEFRLTSFARPGAVRCARQFARWCRNRGILVLQTCDFYANVFGLLAGAWARVPVRIGSRREIKADKTAAQLRLQRFAFSMAHKVVANSTAAANAVAREGVPAGRIETIRNGLDISAFPARPRARGALRTIVTVANLRPEKRHEILLSAMRTVIARHPDARLLIVGVGPRRRALQALAADWGLTSFVQFLGHQEDVGAALAAADIFALASRSEASPNALIEAMAAGLPSVATAVGGIPEIVVDGETGLLVPADDAASFARALLRLMDEPALAERMGAAARQRAIERHSYDRMARAFEQLYLSQLEARSRIPGRSPLPVS
jgi:glycosyltransferase involved in cell wall biosynthesis